MPLPALSSLFFRRRIDQDAIRLALEDETYRQPVVVAARDRWSLLVSSCQTLRNAIAAKRRQEDVALLVAELERREQCAAQARAAYEQAVQQAHNEVWARYRETVAQGLDWTKILTPIRAFSGHTRPFVLEAQKEEKPVVVGPIEGQAWGMGAKR
ncbi:hypothetical protein [Pseudoxanthomonas daejeonensis]|uniref:Uncharacterized protein n=1 Tax=Pseudoxanthomonas daejeonensis TaxID=266062 RepID=A0ABQ6Z937_9GAMM|nr:hypothetical protein [Pseudoxanthomonas daejeonensis]KAF1695994.1 hypothetical protein CSC65_05725 [Pseudoxanthomonas daejeonensis]